MIIQITQIICAEMLDHQMENIDYISNVFNAKILNFNKIDILKAQ